MNEIMVYHWWADPSDRPPPLNRRTPLVHSIATLRGVNQDMPVVVLDGSETPQDYRGWDRRLNFEVRPIHFTLSEYRHRHGWQNLSRLFDLYDFARTNPERVIVYSDLDVFWLNDPLPLQKESDKFCFNGYNSGYFYFHYRSHQVQRFFKLFQAYTLTALNDENFRVVTRMYSDYNPFFVLDETLLSYMYKKMPDLFNLLDVSEHFTADPRVEQDIFLQNPSTIKMLHCHGIKVRNPTEEEEWRREHNRGLCPLLIKELYDNVRRAVGDEGLEELYGNELGRFSQKSLTDHNFIKEVLSTKKSKGYYDLTGS